jgi:hypothetical protein
MKRNLLLILVAISPLSCGATVRELESQAGAPSSPGPTPSVGASTATSNCDVLARISPAPAPPLEIVDLGNGAKRITSAEAGYTIAAPASWIVSSSFFVSSGVPGVLNSSPSFGQAHLTSCDPTKIDRASQIASAGMLSPDVGIRLDIELWRNPKLETPEDYAKNVRIGPDQDAVLAGHAVTIAGQRAYQTTIQDEHRFQPTSGPLEITRQTRLLWLVPVLRQDRMLVLYATPGESALRSQVESMVAKLQISQPVVSQLPVINQRDAILRRWLYDKNGAQIAGRRVEAKLLSYADSVTAMNGSGLLRIDRDPDELFWLVAVSGGPDLPEPRGGLVQSSPRPTTWIEYQAPATTGRYEGTGTTIAPSGTWPPGFDALIDRCH